MLNYKKTELFNEFKHYWDAYPGRLDGKGDMYTCYLWFKAEKPDEDTKVEMMQWMIAKEKFIIHCEKQGKFCAPSKDMQRWLRDLGWTTPVPYIQDKEQGRRQAIDKNNNDTYRERYFEKLQVLGVEGAYDMCQVRPHLKGLAYEIYGNEIKEYADAIV